MHFGSGHNSLFHFYFKKKKYDQCKCEHEEEEELQIIELKKGHVTFRKDHSANKFRTHDYNRVDFLVKLLFRIISLNGNLFFLIISIIQLAVDTLSPFLTWIHVAPLIFYGFFKALKEMFFDFKKLKFDKSFNQMKTRRLSTSANEKVEEIAWEDIEVGDIILLFENDYAPCDLVLLDTSLTLNKENVAYISTKVIDGKKNLITKKCPKITAFATGSGTGGGGFKDFCKSLSGKIEYENPNKNLDTFRGVMSLNQDPKAEILTMNNFMIHLSKLKNIKWAIGIAVYTGKHTKINMNTDWHIRKSNFALVFVNKFNYLMIFFVLLQAVISTVVFLGRSEVIPYLKEYESYIDDSVKFFFFIIQYANFVPLATYFVLDIFEIVHYRNIQFSQTKGIRNHFVDTYTPNAFGNLGMLDYAILDQTVFNLDNKLKVKYVYVDKKLYTIKQDEMLPKVMNLLEKNQSQIEYGSRNDIDGENIPDEPDENNKAPSSKYDQEKKSNKLTMMDSKKKVGFKDFPADYSEATSFKPEAVARIYSRKDEERDHDYLKFGANFKETMKELDPDPNMNSDYIEQLGVDDFVKDILERDIDELMKAILICSEAKCVKTEKLNDKLISSFEEEKALLALAKNLQCTIENKARAQETRVKLKMRNTMLDEVIVGLSESQEQTGKLSVVACPLRKDGSAVIDKAYLYVKGPYNLVRPMLGNNDLEKNTMLDLAAEKISRHGTVPFLFAKKKLGKEEARNFAKNYRNIKANLTMQDYSIDSMFIDLEKDMEIVGMCGIEKQCFMMIQDTLNTLEQSGINRWIVSNESLEKMLVQLNSYGLYKINDYHFYVNASTSETLAIQIKRYMSDFQRIYEIKKKLKNQAEIGLKGGKLMESYKELSDDIKKQMKKYTLLVSGKSLDLLMKDSSSYEHFAFLSYLVGKVVGFNFTPENKKTLVTMIKEKFAKDTYVLTVGTNYTDLSMCHASDIGVICTNFRKNQFVSSPWGDIIISDLTKLKRLLLRNGIRISHQIDHTLYYLFYKSIAITLPLFYFNWFSTMTGTSIYDSVLLFLLFFLFTTLPLIAFSFEKPFSLEYANAFPALYSESRYKKTHLFKKFILRAVLEGCIHSTIIFYIGLYHVGRSMSPDGLTADLVMVSLFFVISLVFVINFKLFFNFSSNSMVFWTGIIWSLTFLFGFIWINVSASFTETMYSGLNYQLDELAGRLTTLFCFFVVIMSCLAFSYVIHHYVIYNDLSSAWNILKYKYRKGLLDQDLTNEKILEAVDQSL